MIKRLSFQAAVLIAHEHHQNALTAMPRNTPSDSTARIKRDDPDEAYICLTCTKKKCTGERRCMESRRHKMKMEGLL